MRAAAVATCFLFILILVPFHASGATDEGAAQAVVPAAVVSADLPAPSEWYRDPIAIAFAIIAAFALVDLSLMLSASRPRASRKTRQPQSEYWRA